MLDGLDTAERMVLITKSEISSVRQPLHCILLLLNRYQAAKLLLP
jgi:hypothetical protein